MTQPPSPPPARPGISPADLAVAVGITLVGLLLLLGTLKIPFGINAVVGPRVFPMIVSVGTLALGALLTVNALRGDRAETQAVAEVIRRWLGDNNRWNSPKYLGGESYGTTRVSGLAQELQNSHWMYLNGVVLGDGSGLGRESRLTARALLRARPAGAVGAHGPDPRTANGRPCACGVSMGRPRRRRRRCGRGGRGQQCGAHGCGLLPGSGGAGGVSPAPASAARVQRARGDAYSPASFPARLGRLGR